MPSTLSPRRNAMARDYEAIGRAYCSDRWSNRELAATHNISEAAIRKMAKKYGWVKGQPYPEPAPKPLPKAEPKLRRADPPASVPDTPPPVQLVVPPADPEAELPELPILPYNPKPDADVSDIEYAEKLARRMLDELHESTLALGEMEDLIYRETAGDTDGRRRLAMLRAVSLPTRATTLKALMQTLTAARGPIAARPPGKKEQQAEAAGRVAGGGRFGTAQPPRLVKG